MRFESKLALLVASLSIIAPGCASNDGRSSIEARPRSGESLQLHSFGAVPLSERKNAGYAVNPVGTLVFGGHEFVGEKVRTRNDGVFASASDGVWRPVSESPFQKGLNHVAIVSADDVFIVAGTPCETFHADASLPNDCDGEAPAAASYDPSDDRWTLLPAPNGLVPESEDRAMGFVALGWSGREAWFFASATSDQRRYLAFDPRTNSWRAAPGLEAVNEDFCVVGSALRAIRSGATSTSVYDGGGLVATDDIAKVPVRTWSLRDDAWIAEPATDKPRDGQVSERVVCGENAAAYLSISKDLEIAGFLWMQSDDGSWVALNPPPITAAARIEVARAGETPIVLSDSGKESVVWAFDVTTSTWQAVLTSAGSSRLWGNGDEVLVVAAHAMPTATITRISHVPSSRISFGSASSTQQELSLTFSS